MKTQEQLRALYEDAHKALQEAIDNGCHLRLSIPANSKDDHDLRIARALDELPAIATHNEELEARVVMAINRELFRAVNYPEYAQKHLLGQDMSKLRMAVESAVLKELRA